MKKANNRENALSLVDLYLADKVVDVRVLNFEEGFKTDFVHFTDVYGDGRKNTRRKNVKRLPGYYNFLVPKRIVAAEYIGKVYTGFIRTDVYLLFVVRLEDGTAQLIKTTEGSRGSLHLLQLSDETDFEKASPASTQKTYEPVKPYCLNKNELPQGSYLVGRDIPAGIYDFFVVYGHGGCLGFAKYDAEGKIIDGTWKSYWVGRKESYEHREVLHVACEAGYTIKITGNVIVKIAHSQKVQIDL